MAYRPMDIVLRHIRRIASPTEAAVAGDGALVGQFVSHRDEGAFQALLQRHGPMVLGVCQRILRDSHASEDAFQATFLVFLRKAHSLRRQELVGNWLYGVAYRTALKARMLAARRRAHEGPLVDEPGAAVDGTVVWRDLRPVLDEELNRLPAKYRQPLVLCYLEGMTVSEVAARLGWPIGSVAGRLARAKERLRLQLMRRGVALSAGLVGTVLCENAPGAVAASLISETLRAAVVLITDSSVTTGEISPSVVEIMEGVLQAMYVSKIKVAAAVVLTLAVLGGGVTYSKLVGQQPDPDKAVAARVQADPRERGAAKEEHAKLTRLSEEQIKALLDDTTIISRLPLSEKMKALLTAQYETAFSETSARWQRLLEGMVVSDLTIQASLRLLEAERALSVKRTDHIVAVTRHWQHMQELEKITKLKVDAGTTSLEDLYEARFYRVQAEIWVEQTKKQH